MIKNHAHFYIVGSDLIHISPFRKQCWSIKPWCEHHLIPGVPAVRPEPQRPVLQSELRQQNSCLPFCAFKQVTQQFFLHPHHTVSVASKFFNFPKGSEYMNKAKHLHSWRHPPPTHTHLLRQGLHHVHWDEQEDTTGSDSLPSLLHNMPDSSCKDMFAHASLHPMIPSVPPPPLLTPLFSLHNGATLAP